MKNHDSVHVEYINQTHRLFNDVMSLGKAHSSTLGFMPEGGFIEHAKKQCVIVAHNDSGLIGYLMFRIVKQSSRISIVHLCVKEGFRRQHIPTQMLDSLREKYQNSFSGISLSCRDDYVDASNLWEKYGFVRQNKKRSRSIEEHHLYQWWYDFNQLDLFRHAQNASVKIKALLDANVIFKLRDSDIEQNPSQDPRPLLADWLIEAVDYYYAPETLNEIARDANKVREEKTRYFIGNFEEARRDIEEGKKVANDLKSIITGSTNSDRSDRKQLASAIASNIPYFITFDNVILEKRDCLEERYPIQIFNPQEFVIEIDQLSNKEEYAPIKLKGVNLHSVARVGSTELDDNIDVFLDKAKSERKSDFKDVVYTAASHVTQCKIKVIKQNDSAIAFYSYKYDKSTLVISFMRLLDVGPKQTLFMQLISDFINKAIRRKMSQIVIAETHLSDYQTTILDRLGFCIHSSQWVKFLHDRIIESSQLSELDCSVLGNMVAKALKEKNTDQINNILLTLEQRFFPLKFSDLDIPCYIIPIKPYWAGQLFDIHISSGDLWGAQPNKLWNIENVYYRHTKPITEIAPARILWYASDEKSYSRSKSIIAASRLDEVMTDKPKLLFQRNKHYGIYEWANIYDLCNQDITQNIRALRFSNTEVFDNPIGLSDVDKIFVVNGRKKNTFASPVKIDKSIFIQIYQKGIERYE